MEESANDISKPLVAEIETDTYLTIGSCSNYESAEPEENSPIKEVALTVPVNDDPSLPVLTFRMWVLGIFSCVLLSCLHQFFWYRSQPLTINAISAQIVVLPLGRFMAAKLTNRVFFEGKWYEFSLNPGPFNVKEHVLISILANSGAVIEDSIQVVTAVKVFYKKHITFFVSLIVVITTKALGFGLAGIFRRFLVEPAAMWWPASLVQVSFFRALHEKEERPKGGLTRFQFFVIAFTCSFAYYIFPGYLFQMLTSLSWICWIFPKSIIVQQLSSGLHGLGIGAFGFDWSTISSFLGSPLASPWFATANVAAGFFLFMYILIPLCYWLNIYKARNFPIFSSDLFTSAGNIYNITSIIDSNFHLDTSAYKREGPVYLSTFFAMTYGVCFASFSATVVHVLLFHGRELWQQSKSSFQQKRIDVHTKLMSKYRQVPDRWFGYIIVATVLFTLFACEYCKDQLQFPGRIFMLACLVATFFTLPIGIMTAITNQAPYLIMVLEYIIGYTYPGYPVANMCFKVYGYISMQQAVTFLQDFKLGHYMKIPPRTVFTAQLVGSVISSFVYVITAWWLMETIPDICVTTSSNSIWTCPTDHVFYDASIMWGLIGPHRTFGAKGTYKSINWFFLGGAIAPLLVWLAQKSFPKQQWIKLINMPILIGTVGMMPPATAVNYTTWLVVGFLSGYVAFRYRPDLWERYNYVLSGALDAGLACTAMFLYIFLGMENISVDWWGNSLDGCPYASCPTAKGIVGEGCPVNS